jgi:hypothetical protein
VEIVTEPQPLDLVATERHHQRAAFAIIDAVAAMRLKRGAKLGPQALAFERKREEVVTAGLVALTFGIVSTESHGWTSMRTLGSMLLGVALIALLADAEARSGAILTERVSGARSGLRRKQPDRNDEASLLAPH